MDLTGRNWELLIGDVRERLADIPDESVQCVVTSPPYWNLRNYGVDGQVGLESTPDEYVAEMVGIFREVRRVLRDDGTLWLNIGDSYCGAPKGSLAGQDKSGLTSTRTQEQSPIGVSKLRIKDATSKQASNRSSDGLRRNQSYGELKPKDLVGIPWMLAFALRDDGWYLRSELPWVKRNQMPGSEQDRPSGSGSAVEKVFLLSKQSKYFFDLDAVRTPMSVGTNGSKFTSGKTAHGKHNLGQAPRSDDYPNGRAFRPADLWFESIAAPHGMVGLDDELVGLDVCSESYSGAHFATFPQRLVRPLILSGTSEKGCCPECGSPWVRIIKKVRRPTRPGENTKIKVPGGWDIDEGSHGTIHRSGRTEATYRETAEVGNRDPKRHTTETRTVGWEPGCHHIEFDDGPNDEHVSLIPVPCTVLDPFAGSGTTLKVAVELGRKAIGIELNPEYAEMARKRILNTKKHAAAGQKTTESLPGQMEMF